MPDVYLQETLYGPGAVYIVYVDGKPYDSMVSPLSHLTWSQQIDVAAGYREALTGYRSNDA